MPPKSRRSRCKSRQLSPSETRSGRTYTSTTFESALRQCVLVGKKIGLKSKNGSRPSTRVGSSFNGNDSNATAVGQSTKRSDGRRKAGRRKANTQGLRTCSGPANAPRNLDTPVIDTHRTLSARTFSSAGENAKATSGSRTRVRRKQRTRRQEVQQVHQHHINMHMHVYIGFCSGTFSRFNLIVH